MKTKYRLVLRIEVLFAAAAFIAVSVPAFNMTGLILKPLLICAIGGATISFILSFIPKGESVCGYSLLLFVVFWSILAFAKELELQIAYNFPWKWIEFFYFDKLLMVGTVWLSATAVFVVMRLMKRNSSKPYKTFFKFSSIAFLIFYVFLILYSFVFIRLESSEYPMNWVPFNTIKEYLHDYSSIPYEVFMMFFGNLFYFTPLGIIFYLKLKKQKTFIAVIVTLIFPPVAFTLLEFSQYILQNGFCEFDDMMMNSLGFWTGALFGCVFDRLLSKITSGRITGFWELK